MRLAFLFENYVVGGGSKYVGDCIDAALAAGHQVTLVANNGAFSESELSQFAKPIDLHTVAIFERNQSTAQLLGETRLAALLRKALYFASPLLFIANLISLCWHLGRIRPDIVVSCNGGYPASEAVLSGVVAARLRKIPSALVFMSQPAARRNSLPGYDRLLDWLALGSAEKLIANSNGQGHSLIALRGADARKVTVIYNGIPDAPYRQQPMRHSSPLTLGLVCRLDPLKGVDYLLQSFARLTQNYDLRLQIVGDGSERTALVALSADLAISERVIFHGHLQGAAMTQAMDSMDIFVFPSLWEGLPYAILEAMRAGLPIVSTNVGGIPEAIGDRSEGLLVPPRSVQGLHDAIEEFIVDKALASRLGQNARSRYEAAFSRSKMQEDFATVVGTMRPAATQSPDSSK